MRNKIFNISFILIQTLFPVSMFASYQMQTTDLLDKKVTMRADKYTPVEFLDALSFRGKIQIGFEEFNDRKETIHRFESIDFRKGTIKEALDEFVKYNNRYKWYAEAGIINVVPIQRENDILETKISLAISKKIDVDQLAIAILMSPEIKLKLTELGLTSGYKTDYDGPIRDMKEFKVRSSNTSARVLLNNALKQGNARFWRVGKLNNDSTIFTIEFTPYSVQI